MLKELTTSLRPKQWYKNLIIFIGIIFSKNLLNHSMWLDVTSAFIIFCMLSGSGYIINDIADRKKDTMHPKKCKRPIASGTLNKHLAVLTAIILITTSLTWSYTINPLFFIASLTFFIMHNAYTFYLKKIILIDILAISIQFIIRAIAGCLAIGVFISPWLIICTFLLALFLALAKRRHELVLLGEDAKNHRKILEKYSTSLLDQMITITTSALIISYTLYTFLTDNIYLMATIPLAVYGLFRYMLLIHAKNFGGETEMIFKDKGILTCLILWIALVILILYTNNIPI